MRIAAFAGLLVATLTASWPQAREATVIAHRGASGHAPEHTFAAWDLALDFGADYIEQDLQMTRDGVLVVLHDESLRRTVRGASATCTGQVRERTLEELRGCDAGSWFNERNPARANPAFARERVPTLREVLSRYGRRTRYYIETKSPDQAPGMEEALVAELRAADLMPSTPDDRTVLVQSFSPASLRRLHAMQPAVPLVQLVSAADEVANLDSAMAAIATYAMGVGPNARLVTAEFMAAARRHRLVVHPWTVNDTLDMRRLVRLGVDGLFTDYPDRLALVLGRR